LLFFVTMSTLLTTRINEAMARLAGDDPDRDKATLLIVDDEKGPRESLRMILSPQHRVLLAVDGRQALDILRSEPVDAVTLDLNMPGIKGDELMRMIRKEFPHVEVIIITGCSSIETAVDGIRHGVFDYLTKPFDVVEVSTTVRRALGRQRSRNQLIRFLRGIGEVLGSDNDPEAAVQQLADHPELRARLREALEDPVLAPIDESGSATTSRICDFIAALAETIESREPHRLGHARRVAFIAGLMAERLGEQAPPSELVRVAAILHDIGRIGETEDARTTPGSPAEKRGVHAEAGAALVEPLGLPSQVTDTIRHHHERWDGTGSPQGLREHDIPLAARILAIADAFDGLTHDQPYRPALNHSAAVEELRKLAGSAFDPNLVREFVSIAESGLCATDPLLELSFAADGDPVNAIAAATAWIEGSR
jgi:putative nucleotidyltransferase with HDIG domain